jgi:major vault protein
MMANTDSMGRDRDLVLAPGEFAFVLDTTKGLINTIVGPNKTSMSNTDQPVVWDKTTRRFGRCETDKAIQIDTIAPEGFYVALYNPAETHPREASSLPSVALQVGHRINVPGPIRFPLWPGQRADVIKGHHLRSNQYLLAQVYNDAAATENWKTAVLKPQGDSTIVKPQGEGEKPPVTPPAATVVEPRVFVPGQLLIIKGTDVAFFIPPTGVKVVPEGGVFVREAVTLERLEYCILLDEDGNKRYVQGPNVVFPEPTEQFVVKEGQRKFKAIDLNETTGIYVKVIADYDEGGAHHKAGDELFITGKEQAIYYQREEHSVIRYGDQTKHYAVAVPSGEGRYVLDRSSGVVSLIKGPTMLLCDPRRQVIIRRVLAEGTAKLWYPGNEKILEVNKALAAMTAAADPSQYEIGRVGATANYMSLTSTDSSRSRTIAGDTFSRGTTFTPPRTITLDTKYEGAVAIAVWTGYAVLKINKTGRRSVVEGPENILLEYDETLAPLELSTGTPKNDTNLLRTVYLRVHNNKVSDKISVETKDLVKLDVSVSYRVNFEGDDKEKWFAVENYVKLLSDHMRSLIRNVVKRHGVESFYGGAIDIIRDAVLGAVPMEPVPIGGTAKPRPGRPFTENGMRVYDLEILDVTITSKEVGAMLGKAQMDAIQSALRIASEERELAITKRSETIRREIVETKAETTVQAAISSGRELTARIELKLAEVTATAEVESKRLTALAEEQKLHNDVSELERASQQATDDLRIATLSKEIEAEIKRWVGESEQIVKRAGAITPQLAVALTTFADSSLVEKISIALAPMAAANGISAADVLAKLFGGTAFGDVMTQLGKHSRMPAATLTE